MTIKLGFLRNQVTPFQSQTPDGETLHAWHILPLETYHKNVEGLRKEPTGLCEDFEKNLSFNYRALSAESRNVQILAIDYRGFGSSTGGPSEPGLLTDALTLAKFALETAGIPPERIVVFAQSLGIAVAMTLEHTLALRSQPTLFAGMVLVAPMADVETTTRTYKIAGALPLISPISMTDLTTPKMTTEDFAAAKEQEKVSLGAEGWEVEWKSVGGVVREKILKHGLYDRIMSYPVVSLTFARAFKTAGEEIGNLLEKK
ncbi:hypothetical protein DM02DRAFT_639395 [Periconia macrospinosa]|uniref:AB hydrolase-1 domain-containing protein n=1 Tax=Periconia macrospinosa TaxID=97972 RepID=A0A2V1E5R8_9PLEO|nr:hypothetical protein DM02DRAFT_639395 [Periconia macrospinosa]